MIPRNPSQSEYSFQIFRELLAMGQPIWSITDKVDRYF